jgi:hypothetical protein
MNESTFHAVARENRGRFSPGTFFLVTDFVLQSHNQEG